MVFTYPNIASKFINSENTCYINFFLNQKKNQIKKSIQKIHYSDCKWYDKLLYLTIHHLCTFGSWFVLVFIFFNNIS